MYTHIDDAGDFCLPGPGWSGDSNSGRLSNNVAEHDVLRTLAGLFAVKGIRSALSSTGGNELHTERGCGQSREMNHQSAGAAD